MCCRDGMGVVGGGKAGEISECIKRLKSRRMGTKACGLWGYCYCVG